MSQQHVLLIRLTAAVLSFLLFAALSAASADNDDFVIDGDSYNEGESEEPSKPLPPMPPRPPKEPVLTPEQIATKRAEAEAALHVAAAANNESAIHAFGRRGATVFGADIDARDSLGRTALHRAAELGRAEATRALAHGGADVNARCPDADADAPVGDAAAARRVAACPPRTTALHFAARAGHEAAHRSVVSVLTENRADARVTDAAGRTPAHDAAEHGEGHALRVLATFGATLDARDNAGQTPLHRAAAAGAVAGAETLLTLWADTTAKDNAGDRPIDLARRCAEGSDAAAAVRCRSVVELLRSHERPESDL